MLVIDPKHRSRPEERGEEKLAITLVWVGEWTFSTIEILSARLGQPASSSTLFFKRLIDQDYLVRFKTDKLARKDLVRIGAKGVRYLKDNYAFDAKRYMRSDELAAKNKIHHDYCAQVYAASVEKNFSAVFSELNIFREKKQRRADALLCFIHPGEKQITLKKEATPAEVEAKKGLRVEPQKFWFSEYAPVAVEYESKCKKPSVVRSIFQSYLFLMLDGKVSQVRFVFPNKKYRERYEKYFAVERWSQHITISSDHPVRARFSFEVLDHNEVISQLSAKKWEDDTEFFMLSGR